MSSERKLRIGVIGGGMFFDDIIGGSLADFQRGGIAGALTSIGQSHFASRVADISVEFVVIGTRNPDRGTAGAIRDTFLAQFPDSSLEAFYGDSVWKDMIEKAGIDVLIVATPDHLHHQPIVDALAAGVDVIAEKPLCLMTSEADEIIALGDKSGLVVAVDMHKRYDPFVRDMMTNSLERYDRINRVRAALEEPLEVSTEVFDWATESNPFAYVGCHWLDVVAHYTGARPVSLYATGEKNLLVNWSDYAARVAELTGKPLSEFSRHEDIETWDAMNVNITYDNGMRGDYNNNWINPADFEGAVNQEIEVFGVLGRGFVDQQDRGFREAITGDGSRTRNPTFGGRIKLGDGNTELFGYGKASLVAGLLAISRRRILGESLSDVQGSYPDAASQRDITMIIEAATRVAELNYAYLQEQQCAPVTAALTEDTITILDALGASASEEIYRRAG